MCIWTLTLNQGDNAWSDQSGFCGDERIAQDVESVLKGDPIISLIISWLLIKLRVDVVKQ